MNRIWLVGPWIAWASLSYAIDYCNLPFEELSQLYDETHQPHARPDADLEAEMRRRLHRGAVPVASPPQPISSGPQLEPTPLKAPTAKDVALRQLSLLHQKRAWQIEQGYSPEELKPIEDEIERFQKKFVGPGN